MAADAAGIDPGVAKLAFPGGAVDMIDAWFAHIDRAMLAALPPETLAAMKVRERITALVEARLAAAAPRSRGAAPRARGAGDAAERRARGAARLAHRRPDLARGRRHRDRLQPLYQAHDPARRLWRDDRGVPGRRERGLRRHARVPGAADRRHHAVREGQGAAARTRRTGLPSLSRFVGRLRYPAV